MAAATVVAQVRQLRDIPVRERPVGMERWEDRAIPLTIPTSVANLDLAARILDQINLHSVRRLVRRKRGTRRRLEGNRLRPETNRSACLSQYIWIDHVDGRAIGKRVYLIKGIAELQVKLILGDVADVWGCQHVGGRQQRMRGVGQRLGVKDV